MRIGSLFAGIGGFDLAAESAGMDVAWQSENDAPASQVLAHHWPNVPNLGDIHGITEPPNVDILTGGFPCQDYSVAGRGAGLAGDRGALWWQFHRIIDFNRPTWVVGENVHGLTTRKHRDAFRTIVGSLVQLGYGVVWRVLDAQFFGVAQRRRRVFIVGHSGGQPRPEVLALAQGVSGDTPPSRDQGSRVAALTANGVGAGGGPDDNAAQAGRLIAFSSKDYGADASDISPTLRAMAHDDSHLNGGGQVAVAFTQNQRDEVRDLDDLAGGLQAEPGMKQQPYVAVHPTLAAQPSGPGGQDEEIHHMVLSPTVRRLTPLECERLQGFPDHWTATPGNSDSQRYKQLGNAVAVPAVEWILGNIAKAHSYLTT